uniref:Uncharacterized protein n=1 Tax=Oncorhynchus tshawytscha TaxID=74940 RepID=A0AAZ3P550_ONCTS
PQTFLQNSMVTKWLPSEIDLISNNTVLTIGLSPYSAGVGKFISYSALWHTQMSALKSEKIAKVNLRTHPLYTVAHEFAHQDTTAWLQDTTAWLQDTTAWLQDTTAWLQDTTAWLQDTTAWLQDTTAWLQDTTFHSARAGWNTPSTWFLNFHRTHSPLLIIPYYRNSQTRSWGPPWVHILVFALALHRGFKSPTHHQALMIFFISLFNS